MNDAGLVRGGERAAGLDGVVERLGKGEGPSVDLLAEGLAIDEFSSDERDIAGLPDVVDGDDVGVVESGSGTGFLSETENPLGVLCRLGREQLQGDFAIEASVLSEVDFAHAAPSEQTGEAVGTEGGTICGLEGHEVPILAHLFLRP